jgi:hypothetical protein
MTMSACKECGHQVSDRAASCPNCGSPIAEEKKARPSGGRIASRALIAFAAAWLIVVTLLLLITVRWPERLSGAMQRMVQAARPSPASDTRTAAEPAAALPASLISQAAVTRELTRTGEAQGIRQVSIEQSPPPRLVYRTSAEQLYQDYESNAVQTQGKIGDSWIRVTGTVAEIDEDSLGNPVVRLTAGSGRGTDLRLTADQQSAAAQLVKGQSVEIQCDKMQHVSGSPLGSGCALVLVDAGSRPMESVRQADAGPSQVDSDSRQLEAASRHVYLSLFFSNEDGTEPLYIIGPMSEAACLAGLDNFSERLQADRHIDHVLYRSCAPTQRDSAPPRGCRLSSSLSALPDMPMAHLWRYDCGGTRTLPARRVPAAPQEEPASLESTSTVAVPVTVPPIALTGAAAAVPPSAIPAESAAVPALGRSAGSAGAPGIATSGQSTTAVAAARMAVASSAPSGAAAAVPSANAGSTTISAAAAAPNSTANSMASAAAPAAAVATVATLTPAPAAVSTTGSAAAAPVPAAAKPTSAAASDDLATVRAQDPQAAERIAKYCAGVTDESACRRNEKAAWTRLVLQNEFPTLDEATRRKCNEPPFPLSYVANEVCARYELHLDKPPIQ